MTIGVWILGDQLSATQAALQSCDQANTAVILIESLAHVRVRPYHRQKLVLVWSAMRHFAEALRAARWQVTYVSAAEDFVPVLDEWIRSHCLTELRVMQPADRPFAQFIQTLQLPCPIRIIPSNQFLWSDGEFRQWASNRKRLLLEDFYREGRKRFRILMQGDQPIGGVWNLDKENRKPPKQGLHPPQPLWIEPDAITQAVIEQVRNLDMPLYGNIEPFRWAVTRTQVLQLLTDFISHRLPTFGPYEDAMVTGQDTLWHSLLSPYLNLGLLHPLEVIQAVEQAFIDRNLPLNSVEGCIRQVLGWREYMRGLYAYVGDDYPQRNWFNHHHPLPDFFWTGDTEMNCLRQVLDQVQRTGYAHHIQRLMILSNFALIAGISPQALENWFHAAFIDAYDWVMQPNVIGMGQFADGGILASKPYASSANYINTMSDYCKGCIYSPKARTGGNACPFNVFYWDFLIRHRVALTSQGRMSMILKNIDRFTLDEIETIRQQAADWHYRLSTVQPTKSMLVDSSKTL